MLWQDAPLDLTCLVEVFLELRGLPFDVSAAQHRRHRDADNVQRRGDLVVRQVRIKRHDITKKVYTSHFDDLSDTRRGILEYPFASEIRIRFLCNDRPMLR